MEADVDAFPALLAPGRHQEHAQPLKGVARSKAATENVEQVGRGAEEQAETGEEVPGPHLALGQDRRHPLRKAGETKPKVAIRKPVNRLTTKAIAVASEAGWCRSRTEAVRRCDPAQPAAARPGFADR